METNKSKIEKSLPRYQSLLETPVLYEHYEDAIREWDFKRWPHFSPDEPTLACPLTGTFYLDPVSFDFLESARVDISIPFTINSGHRSPEHNIAIGGAPKSAHLKIAFDISLNGHDKHKLHGALKTAGFTSFGFYKTFIHTDTRTPARLWYGGEEARRIWTQ